MGLKSFIYLFIYKVDMASLRFTKKDQHHPRSVCSEECDATQAKVISDTSTDRDCFVGAVNEVIGT